MCPNFEYTFPICYFSHHLEFREARVILKFKCWYTYVFALVRFHTTFKISILTKFLVSGDEVHLKQWLRDTEEVLQFSGTQNSNK
jgi:hypothetical protein